MSSDVPDPPPPVIPNVTYEDTGAAVEWLARVFGFRTA